MAQAPGKLATLLLLVVAFGGLAAWLVVPFVMRDKPSILTDFLDILQQSARRLEPEGRVPVALPPLKAGELVVLAMGPNVTTLGKDIDLSTKARTTIARDLAAHRPPLTFLYLIEKGEVRRQEAVSRCNLTLAGSEAFVIAPTSSRIAYFECGPIGTKPGECRDFHGLWNERCTARLVAE